MVRIVHARCSELKWSHCETLIHKQKEGKEEKDVGNIWKTKAVICIRERWPEC